VAEAKAGIPALERIAAECWPAATVEMLEGWRLGFMDGVTRRANSVLPLAWSGGRPLENAIDAVEARYGAHGQPAVFKLTDASLPGDLPAALDARAYGAEGASDVLARRADGLAGCGGHEVRLLEAPTTDWCAISFSGRSPEEAAVLGTMTKRLDMPCAFALVEIGGAPVCAGFAAMAERWSVIAGVHTLSATRRQGAARSLMAALARWSVEAGAPMLVLQVECENAAGQALYRSLGFGRLYGYHYRVAQS